MLTKTDLQKIGKIVKTEVQQETRKVVHEETRKIVQQETKKIVQQETRKIVQQETRKIVKEELVPIKKDIYKIKGNINDIIGFFDTEHLKLKKRVDRIEDHLSLPPVSN